MSVTLLSKVDTETGEVIVMTKTRYLLFFNMPRTSVMPWHMGELRSLGVQFHWKTSDRVQLERLHNLLLQTLRDGMGLADLRYIAEVGKQLMQLGLPFVPGDAPVPESLKQVSEQIKRVV